MRIIEKKRFSDGRRHVCLLGVKIFSYEKEVSKKKPDKKKFVSAIEKTRRRDGSLLYRIFTYPVAVYDEYQYLKGELKKMK